MPRSQILRRTLYRADKLEVSSRIWNPGVSKFSKDDMDFYTISANVKIIMAISNEKFVVEWKDHLKVLTFFEQVTNWFYDEDMKDLFFRDEKGELFFNGEYNNLTASTYTNQYTHSFIEAKPLLLSRDNKKLEGVLIRINVMDACACLCVRELLELSSILHTFDYSSETALFMQVSKQLSYVDNKGGDMKTIITGQKQATITDPFNLKQGGFM